MAKGTPDSEYRFISDLSDRGGTFKLKEDLENLSPFKKGSDPLSSVRRKPTTFDALMDMQRGETVGDALARLRREIQAEEDRKMQEFVAEMAALGIVVEPTAPGDPLARIDFKPVGGRGRDDKDSSRRFPEPKVKIKKTRYLDEEPDGRIIKKY